MKTKGEQEKQEDSPGLAATEPVLERAGEEYRKWLVELALSGPRVLDPQASEQVLVPEDAVEPSLTMARWTS